MKAGWLSLVYILWAVLVLALVVVPLGLVGAVLMVPGLAGVGCWALAAKLMVWTSKAGPTGIPKASPAPAEATPFERAARQAADELRRKIPLDTGFLRGDHRRRMHAALGVALGLWSLSCAGYHPNMAADGPTKTQREYVRLVALWSDRMAIEEPAVFFRRLPADRCGQTDLGAVQTDGLIAHQRYVVSFDTSARCRVAWFPNTAVVHELCHQRLRHMIAVRSRGANFGELEAEALECVDAYLLRERRGDYR